MASTYTAEEFDERITEAQEYLRLASDADSNNRQEALEDLKFAAGDQWPVEIQNSRTYICISSFSLGKNLLTCFKFG